MRNPLPIELERRRVCTGKFASSPGDPDGAFILQHKGARITIIANAAHEGSFGWEHVSISLRYRTPTWEEMCYVKNLFWPTDECVVQYHPPDADYVNCHPFCLHLWRHIVIPFPMPPALLVGPKRHG
jgi:hypothetical protein